jgi:hypothetical protein
MARFTRTGRNPGAGPRNKATLFPQPTQARVGLQNGPAGELGGFKVAFGRRQHQRYLQTRAGLIERTEEQNVTEAAVYAVVRRPFLPPAFPSV